MFRTSPVVGKEPERSALERGDGPEAALVESEEAPCPVPVGEHDEGGVGQAELQIAVTAGHVASEPELGLEKIDDGTVIRIVTVRLGVQRTGVDDQRHESAGAAFAQPPLRELVR